MLLCLNGISFLFYGVEDIFQKGLSWYGLVVVSPLIGAILAMYTIDAMRRKYPDEMLYSSLLYKITGNSFLVAWVIIGGILAVITANGFLHFAGLILFNITGKPYWLIIGILGVVALIITIQRKAIAYFSMVAIALYVLYNFVIFYDGVNALVINWHTVSFFSEATKPLKYIALIVTSYVLSLHLPFAQIYLLSERQTKFKYVALQYSIGYLIISAIVFVGFFSLVYGIEPEGTKNLTSEYLRTKYKEGEGGGFMILLTALVVLTVSMVALSSTLYATAFQFSKKQKHYLVALLLLVVAGTLQLLFFPKVIEWWSFTAKYWYYVLFIVFIPLSLYKVFSIKQQIITFSLISLTWIIVVLYTYQGFFITLDYLVFLMTVFQITLVSLIIMFN